VESNPPEKSTKVLHGGIMFDFIKKISFVFTICIYSLTGYAAEPITIVTSSTVGGGPYTNATIIAKYLSKHMEGNPKVIVSSMQGAGGLVLNNWLYNKADQQNTIATVSVNGNSFVTALSGKNPQVKYDLNNFKYLFATNDGDNGVFVIWAHNRKGLTNIQQMREKSNPFIFGNQDTSENNLVNYMLTKILKIESKMVYGYKNIHQAILSNEIDARFGTLQNTVMLYPEWLKKGHEIQAIAQVGALKRSPVIPEVPLFDEFVTDNEHKKVLELFRELNQLTRPYFGGPGMTPERVKQFAEAGKKIANDPEYDEEMIKIGGSNSFVEYEEMNQIMKMINNTDKSVIDLIN
jgi:tripartite-type tricarboxylate transporter receptor subunit TctC